MKLFLQNGRKNQILSYFFLVCIFFLFLLKQLTAFPSSNKTELCLIPDYIQKL